MNPKPASVPIVRIVQTLLLLLGALLVMYAVSDHPLYGGEPGFGMLQKLISVIGVMLALCAFLPVRISSGILLIAITTLFMLLLAEVAGEALLKQRLRPIFQYDDRLIFKFISNRDSVMTRSPVNGGNTVPQHINSSGFRGAELLPPGKALRVAVYGDSFIHASYSPQEETFAAQLGMQLEKRLARKVEVVNAGVSSYGPDQELLKMENELPWLRPDLVVVAIFAGNDYGDLMRNKIFRLRANGEVEENRWVLDPDVRYAFELSQRESIIKRAARNVFGQSQDRSKFFNLDFLLKEADGEYRSFIVERNNTVTNTHVDYYSADISLMPRSESARYKVALMGAVMQRIRDVAKRNGVPLVFLFIPHPVDVTDHYDSWHMDRKRFPDYNGRNQIAPLEEAGKLLGVPFLSLFDMYRRHDANTLYFHDDDHWNGSGQRMAAEAMTDYLLSPGMLGSRGVVSRGAAGQ